MEETATILVELTPTSIETLADAIASRQTTSTAVSIETTLPVQVASVTDPGFVTGLILILFVLGAMAVLALRRSL